MELPPPPQSCSGCPTLWTLCNLASSIVSSAEQIINTSKIELCPYTYVLYLFLVVTLRVAQRHQETQHK